jgi:hypothetical protein
LLLLLLSVVVAIADGAEKVKVKWH